MVNAFKLYYMQCQNLLHSEYIVIFKSFFIFHIEADRTLQKY